MSAFCGAQGRGAARRHREAKRLDAERRARERRCGKVRYPTEYDARVALVGTVVGRNRGQAKRQERRVYECDGCNGWHLTSKPERTTTP